MSVKLLTVDELHGVAETIGGDDAVAVVDRWLDRGDGAAVYQNHDLGHPELGQTKIVSYGSEAAQLECAAPPVRLPDIGGEINWRYMLVGYCPPAQTGGK